MSLVLAAAVILAYLSNRGLFKNLIALLYVSFVINITGIIGSMDVVELPP